MKKHISVKSMYFMVCLLGCIITFFLAFAFLNGNAKKSAYAYATTNTNSTNLMPETCDDFNMVSGYDTTYVTNVGKIDGSTTDNVMKLTNKDLTHEQVNWRFVPLAYQSSVQASIKYRISFRIKIFTGEGEDHIVSDSFNQYGFKIITANSANVTDIYSQVTEWTGGLNQICGNYIDAAVNASPIAVNTGDLYNGQWGEITYNVTIPEGHDSLYVYFRPEANDGADNTKTLWIDYVRLFSQTQLTYSDKTATAYTNAFLTETTVTEDGAQKPVYQLTNVGSSDEVWHIGDSYFYIEYNHALASSITIEMRAKMVGGETTSGKYDDLGELLFYKSTSAFVPYDYNTMQRVLINNGDNGINSLIGSEYSEDKTAASVFESGEWANIRLTIPISASTDSTTYTRLVILTRFSGSEKTMYIDYIKQVEITPVDVKTPQKFALKDATDIKMLSGDSLDNLGLRYQVTYTDGTSALLPDNAVGYTYGELIHGQNTVTAIYSGLTCELDVFVLDVNVKMKNGASVRVVTGTSGLRFTMTMSDAEYQQLLADESYESIEFGMLIAPKSYDDNQSLNYENVFGDNAVYNWKLPDEDYVEEAGKTRIINLSSDKMGLVKGERVLNAVITNVKTANYEREFIGKGYVKLTDTNGNVSVFFAAMNDNVKTVSDVAENLYADKTQYRNLLVEQREIINDYIAPTPIEEITIFPQVKTLNISDSYVSIDGNIAFGNLPTNLQNELKNVVGKYSVYTSSVEAAADIRFIEDTTLGYAAGGYKIVVNGDTGITVSYVDEAGAFYAIQTLDQIFSQTHMKVPYMTIEDWPDIATRGMLLDMARNKVPSVETMKELIDDMSAMKMNAMILFVEFPSTIACEKSFTLKDGTTLPLYSNKTGLTIKECQEISEYAKSKYIDIIPMIETIGHLENLLVYEGYASFKETDTVGCSTICVQNENAQRLLKAMIETVLECFPYTTTLHIGGDESYEVGRGQSLTLKPGLSRAEIYLDSLQTIHKIVKSVRPDMKMLVYHDMMYAECTSAQVGATFAKMEDIKTTIWSYEIDDTYTKQVAFFKNAGVDYEFMPSTNTFGSCAGRLTVGETNIKTAVSTAMSEGGKPVFVSVWGDCGHRNLMTAEYTGLACAATLTWRYDGNFTPRESKSHIDYVGDNIFESSNPKLITAWENLQRYNDLHTRSWGKAWLAWLGNENMSSNNAQSAFYYYQRTRGNYEGNNYVLGAHKSFADCLNEIAEVRRRAVELKEVLAESVIYADNADKIRAEMNMTADMMIYLCDYTTLRLRLYQKVYETYDPVNYQQQGAAAYEAQINTATNNNDLNTLWSMLTDVEKKELSEAAAIYHANSITLEKNYREYWALVNQTGEIESSVNWLMIPDQLYMSIAAIAAE